MPIQSGLSSISVKARIVNGIFKKNAEKSAHIPEMSDPLGGEPGESGDSDRNLLQPADVDRFPIRSPGIEMEAELIAVLVDQAALSGQGTGVVRSVYGGRHGGGGLPSPEAVLAVCGGLPQRRRVTLSGGGFCRDCLAAGYQRPTFPSAYAV